MRTLTAQGPAPTAKGCYEEPREAPRRENRTINLKPFPPLAQRTSCLLQTEKTKGEKAKRGENVERLDIKECLKSERRRSATQLKALCVRGERRRHETDKETERQGEEEGGPAGEVPPREGRQAIQEGDTRQDDRAHSQNTE